jgi:hypothetical protein
MNREKRKAYELLVGKPEAKKPLGKQRCRWVDNIKVDIGVIGCGSRVCLRAVTSGELL